MTRLAPALAAVCALLLGAVAAPALSLRPYRPTPVDFELRAPGGAPARAAGPLVSPPLRAPKRFNLVGLRWRGGAEPRIAVRARREGGRWTGWTRLVAEADHGPDPGGGEHSRRGLSSPTWVGEADVVQYRLSRPVPDLRLHFVNVKGTTTAADRARTTIRRLANAALVSLGGAAGVDPARAQGEQPPIVSREAWGAKDCQPRAIPDYGVVEAAFVHHTVSANDYTAAEAPAMVLAICRYHRNSNGWNDIGYNFLVDKYGAIYEGRAGGVDEPVVGAQAQGYNAQTTGIAGLGSYSQVRETDAALDAMARLIRWKLPLHGVPTFGTTTLVSAGGSTNRYSAGRTVTVPRVVGHRDLNKTECPGGALSRQLPELRRRVGAVAPLGVGTTVTARLSSRSVPYTTPVQVTGTLGSAEGPLRGAAVEIQRFRGRWETVARAVTDVSGGYGAVVRPRSNRWLRVRFSGDGRHLPGRSRPALLRVRPLISVAPVSPRSGRRGLRIAGTVVPAKRRLHLVLQVRRGARYRRLGVRVVRVRRGRFRTSFRPARAGLYRFYLVARPDRATARARSVPVMVEIGPDSGGPP